MKEHNILIIDDDRAFTMPLAQFLTMQPDVNIIKVAHTHNDALNFLQMHTFDIILLDLVMPEGDGYELLAKIHAEYVELKSDELSINKTPKIVILTSFSGKQAHQKAVKQGATHFIAKPIKPASLLEYIRNAAQDETEDLRARTEKLFHDIGMPTHTKGYKYLLHGVEAVTQAPEILESVTKRLYPLLATKFNDVAANIERNMRSLIETTWDRGNLELLTELFGHTISMSKGKPTNSEFLAKITRHLSNQQECQ